MMGVFYICAAVIGVTAIIREMFNKWLSYNKKIEELKVKSMIEVEHIKAKNKLEIEKLYLETKVNKNNNIVEKNNELEENIDLNDKTKQELGS